MPRTFSNKEKAAECSRELRQRRHVYPRLIADGRLSQEAAARQISLMEDMLQDYQQRAELDQPDLFGDKQP